MRFKPFFAYSASAGSGKTFALSVRYISLLFMGEAPSSILAATFTNKAASEMRQRVVDSLREIPEMLHDKKKKVFIEQICEQTGFTCDEIVQKQPEVLARFLASSSYIVTLDSFFSSILRSASLELDLEPDFVTKEQGDEKLEMHFLEEVQAQGLLSSLVKLAMDIEDKRFGKIFDLMQNFYKVDPLLPNETYEVVNIANIEDKVNICRDELYAAVIESGASKTAIGNFAPASAKTLSSKTVFNKETLLEHRNYKKYVVKYPQIEIYFQKLKSLLEKWIKAKEVIVLHNLFKIYDYYRNATITNAKTSGILSFDDLSYFTYRLLHESISREFFYFKIDSKFKHILLDEFQDTSTLQFLLLKPLIDEIFAGHGQSEFKSFFYVGDTKQSLYRFRGGVEELFDKVADHYEVEIKQMDTNYRSSKNVVEQVNRWFEPIMEGYVPQKSKEEADEGYVEVMESEVLIDEAVKQAKRLLELGVNVDDIAFLVSTNKDGQALHELCEAKGIHTLLKTSSSLKYMPKIAALVAMVSYLFYGEKIDAEAMLLRVGKSLDEIDLSWFSVFMSPSHVVDRLVREFGYFDADLNILKLLEFASVFNDIPTFLEELETSNIAVASHSVHGSKIMTIHGSKGLEFEYVILLDRLGKANSDKSPLIFHYNDDLYIDKILYRTSGRENFDETYACIIEERKASSLKDRMNVLYVALTRAVEGMIVLRKPKDSMFDEIDMRTMRLGSLKVKSEEKIVKREEESEQITISNYGTQEVPTREDDEEKDYEAILFGTALHYTLEMMGSFNEESLGAAVNALQNKYGEVLNQVQTEQIEQRVRRLIDDEFFQSLLKGAVLYKEQALSYKGELKQIDLLLEYEDRYIVVDYKSSEKYHLKHRDQVNFYRKAITNLTKKQTMGAIVYLLEKEIIIENLK
ncbi:MAG: recombinase RecB [Epsilonproteobacteria bacterium (ex Lamellibrachia satsuma)]|nr:MAG: recombinase RecB [Epsilonproteobacteria bacterium (ex Lamellibrachia satsuma)]